MDSNDLRREIGKCSFCGFCEYVCPTYVVSGERLYSPRGRINIIRKLISTGKWDKSMEKSLYTCLLCRACEPECPSKISIVDSIIAARNLMAYDKRIIVSSLDS